MDPQRPIYPQMVRKKSVGRFHGKFQLIRNSDKLKIKQFWQTNVKTSPRDYRKWIRSVRFTPKGSENKKGWGSSPKIKLVWQQMLEFDLASIKNGSAASDLPPEGPKKSVGWIYRRTQGMQWRPFFPFYGHRCLGRALRTQNSGLRAQNSGLRTPSSELRTQDSGLGTQDSGRRTQNS